MLRRRTSAFVHERERSAGVGARGFRDALYADGAKALAPAPRGFVFRRGMRTWSLALDPVDERFLLVGTATSRVLLFDLRALDDPRSCYDTSCALPPVCAARAVEKAAAGALQLGVSSVDWYPLDGGLFVSSALDGRVRVWDSDAFVVVSELALGAKVFAAGYSRAAPATHALVAAATAQREVRLCDLVVGAATHSLLGHRDEVWTLAWSPTNEFELASGARDGEVRLWDIRRSGATACRLCLSHEGDAAAPGRASVATNVPRPPPPVSLSAAARPATTRKRPRVDALQTPRRNDPHAAATVSPVSAHLAGVNSLAYTPDGRFLLSSGLDQRLRLWHSRSGAHQFVRYDGVRNELAARRVQMAVVQEGDSTLAFHPNGRDGQLGGYEVFGDRGAPVLRTTAHYGQIAACVYRPSTRELWTGGDDGLIMKWQPPPVDLCGDDDDDEDKAGGDADAWSDDDDEEEEAADAGDVFVPPILRR